MDRAKHDTDASLRLVSGHRQDAAGSCGTLGIPLADDTNIQVKLGHPIIWHRGRSNGQSDEFCFSRTKVDDRGWDGNPFRRHAFDDDVKVILIRVIIENTNGKRGSGFRSHSELFFFDGYFELVVLTLVESIAIHHRSF